ncbi:LysR substrate-binding domain-containing protein, partial [Georgenia sp. 10Sc9-8]|nr:LysR substrate-binding domain-containing protein [Georgenia halotolerans]
VPVVVAAKDHPVAAFEEVDVTDLAAEHLLQDPAEVPEWGAVAEEVRDGTRAEVPPMSAAQSVEVAASGAGVVILPMSVARLHHRKDVVHRPVTGVTESQVGLAWLVNNEDPRVETFIGIVRGRTERSTRGGSTRGEGGAQGAAPQGEPDDADRRTQTGSRGAGARGRGN